jgi:hypothetical protein
VRGGHTGPLYRSGRLGRFDRSCWPITGLGLLHLAFRNHGSKLAELLVPLLLQLLLPLLLKPQTLRLPFLSASQPWRTTPWLKVICYQAAATGFMIIGHDRFLDIRVNLIAKNHRSLAYVLDDHIHISNLYDIIGRGPLWVKLHGQHFFLPLLDTVLLSWKRRMTLSLVGPI